MFSKFIIICCISYGCFMQLAQAAPAQVAEASSPCFKISSISLSGDPKHHFQFALDPVISGPDAVIGRCLDLEAIQAVQARVQNALIEEGFVTTRVLLTPQDLSTGELILAIIPGRINKIRFEPEISSWSKSWRARPMLEGNYLNLRDIEQGLENLKRLPTVDADISIEPAKDKDAQAGESDLVIKTKQKFPLRLSLAVDDAGNKATGKYQGSATFFYDNPLRLNDLFSLNLTQDLSGVNTVAGGMKSGSGHYSLPFGHWLLAFNAGFNNYYQTVAGIGQNYIYKGESKNGDLELSRTLYRNKNHKTSFSFGSFIRSSKQFLEDVSIDLQNRRTAGWKAGMQHKAFIGKATVDASFNHRRGTGAFNARPAPEEAFGGGTSRFKISTATLGITVPFQKLRYNGTWHGQKSHTLLTPQDWFAIGNRNTVRGFDGSLMLLAENGWFLRNDLAVALGKNSKQEVYLGFDYGQVSGPSAKLLEGNKLAGSVLGLRGDLKNFKYDFFLGHPLYKPDNFKAAKLIVGFSLRRDF